MSVKFKELDVVTLKHNVPKYSLNKGSKGTIVQMYNKGTIFAVEFLDNDGYTTAVIDLAAKDVDFVWRRSEYESLTFSDRPVSETKDESKYWTSVIDSKPDPTGLFTDNFAF